MIDLRLQRVCQHDLFDQVVTIQGLSPNYFSILPVASDGSSNFIIVREFSKTEGLSNFIYSRDGFTNWRLSADFTQINWNGLTSANFGSIMGGPGSGIASFLDGTTFITPPPTMLVSYRTTPTLCPISQNSLGLSKDIDFDNHGQLKIVTGNDKVRQLIFKALLTELGSNPVLPTYGSTLSSSIGQKFDSFVEFQIYNSVMQAINFLVDAQTAQPDLPLDETILGIANMGVIQDDIDPRIVRITMNVTVGTLDKVDVNFAMTVN